MATNLSNPHNDTSTTRPDSEDSTPKSEVCLPNRKRYMYKIIVLFLLSYIQGGVIFTIQMIAGLNNTIIRVMKITDLQYEIFFSSFTWPSIILCAVSGVIIDNLIGNKLGLICGIFLSIIGAMLTAMGAYIDTYTILFIGRYIMGAGNELQEILIIRNLYVCFGRRGFNFTSSVYMSIGQLFGTTAILSMQHLYESLSPMIYQQNHCLGVTLLIGVVIQVGSLVAGVLVIVIEKKAAIEEIAPSECIKGNVCEVVLVVKKLILEVLSSFDLWLVMIAIAIYIPVVYTFSSTGQRYLMQKYAFPIHHASLINSLLFNGAAIVGPFIGLMVSTTGYVLYWIQLGVLLAILSHSLFIGSSIKQHVLVYVANPLYALSYSLFSSAVSGAPGDLVPLDQLSTTYGISKSVRNVFFAVISLLSGVIIDFCGYFMMEVFYLILMIITFTILLVLIVRTSNRLNESHADLKCCDNDAGSDNASDKTNHSKNE